MPSVHRNTCSADDTMSIGPTDQPNAPPPPKSAQDDVVAWCQPAGPRPPAPSDAGPPCSPQELALALQAHRDRRNAIEALTNAKEPITAVVESAHDNTFNTRLLEFHLATEKDPAFQQMLETFSREEVSEALGRLVKDAKPDAGDDEVRRVQQRLVSEIDQRLLQRSASAMRSAVVTRLEQAATGFEALAGDPQHHAQVRDSLGLSSDADVPAALRSNAKLMRQESERLSTAGETTLYRGLLLHSASLPVQPGVAGSWARDGVQSVLARGRADENAITAAKTAAAVGVAMASGGMGLGGLAGVGMAASFNAPSVLNAWVAIDQARAGALAGTADARAVHAAQVKAVMASGEGVVSMAAAGYLGRHATHAIAQFTFDAGKSAALDGAVEAAIGAAAHHIGH